jgi:hypothetical protein
VENEHGVGNTSIGIADRLAEGQVVHAQRGQRLTRIETEIVENVIAFLRR